MSCDLDHLYKLLFYFLMEAPDFDLLVICREVSEKKMFENNVYIHVHDPRAGADNPLGSIAFMFTLTFYQIGYLLRFISY